MKFLCSTKSIGILEEADNYANMLEKKAGAGTGSMYLVTATREKSNIEYKPTVEELLQVIMILVDDVTSPSDVLINITENNHLTDYLMDEYDKYTSI